MNKNHSLVPVFCVTLLLQVLFLIIGVSMYEDAYETSITLGYFFFLLIPVNLILLIMILVNKHKSKMRNNTSEMNHIKTVKVPQREILKTYVIEFPFYGVKGSSEGQEENFFDGKEAYQWINDSDRQAIESSWNENDMISFIEDKQLKGKIQASYLYVCDDGTCKIIVSIYEELTETEKEVLLNFVKGQASDGWGEGNFDFEDGSNNSYRVSFWRYNSNWYIKYREEDLAKILLDRYKQMTEKECYEIELVEGNPDVKDNKIGGVPYLPVGEEYPKDAKGNPLALLLQVNLKDVSLENFPSEGILEIFVTPDVVGTYQSSDYTIKIFKDDLEYQTEGISTIDLKTSEFIVQKSYSINLKKTKCYMPYNDFRFEKTIKGIADDIVYHLLRISPNSQYDMDSTFGDIINLISDENGVYIPKICIGGYADFTQSDPRENPDLLSKTECIFKLDSSYDTNKLFIGDTGILFALISKEELQQQEFNKALVDFDCY